MGEYKAQSRRGQQAPGQMLAFAIFMWITALAAAETMMIGGATFTIDRPAIEKFVKPAESESYAIGEYVTEVISWDYVPQLKFAHQHYFRNPGVMAAKRHLVYKGKPHAPVRIYKVDTDTGEQVTLGHLIIDSDGKIVTDYETLLVLYPAMYAFGTKSSRYIDGEIDFFSIERKAIDDDVADYEEQLSLGKNLKYLTTAGSLALSALAGDPTGAALSAFSTTLFFAQLHEIESQSTDLAPRTIAQQEGSVAELAGKAATGADTISMARTLLDMNKLYAAQNAKPLSFAQAFSRSINQDLVKEKATVGGAVLTAINMIEKSDDLTQKAAEWRIKAEAALKLADKIVMVLGGIDDGIQDLDEAQEIQNLKYTAASFGYLRGRLLKETLEDQEYRQKYTVSGQIYGLAKWVGAIKGGPDEAAATLSQAYLAAADADRPGLANTAIDGYNTDVSQAVAQAAWTLSRIEGEFPPTPAASCELLLSGVLDDHYGSKGQYLLAVSVNDEEVYARQVPPFEHGKPFARVFNNWHTERMEITSSYVSGTMLKIRLTHSGSTRGDWIGIDSMTVHCGEKETFKELSDYRNYGRNDGAAGIVYGGTSKTWTIKMP